MIGLYEAANRFVSNLDSDILPLFDASISPGSAIDFYYPKARLRKEGLSPESLTLLHQEFPSHEASGASNRYPYHEWNIQEHSKMFLKHFRDAIEKKGIFDSQFPLLGTDGDVTLALGVLDNEYIDGVSKQELLYFAMAFHDTGKFFPLIDIASDGRTHNSLGNLRLTHPGHETLSAELMDDPKLLYKEAFNELGITQSQKKYIKTMIAMHYELGKLRSRTNAEGHYNLEFINSAKFDDVLVKLLNERKNKPYVLEIALMFLFDGLAKATIPPSEVIEFNAIKSEKDLHRERIRAWSQNANKPPKLYKAFEQMPITLAVAKKALKLALSLRK